MRRKILVNGDSWAFGSEVMAPEFMLPEPDPKTKRRYITGVDCHMECNDYYRIPRIWPTRLGKYLDADIVNIAIPARSNDTIIDTTILWVTKNYIVPKIDTSDLTVVIGWSSPERKNIIINEDEKISWYTLWPMMEDTKYYSSPALKEFFKFYVTHQWVEQEYIKRYVEQNYQLQNFLKLHNIKYKFFNAFYAQKHKSPDQWENISIPDVINNWDNLNIGWSDPYYDWSAIKESLLMQWGLIDNFIMKDEGSFRDYIYQHVPAEVRMNNWHPSPESHEAWAHYLSGVV